jgi:hypothetical protein
MVCAWPHFLKRLALSLLTVGSFFTLTPNAYSLDIHKLFETRCGHCHQHSGELALKKLVIENGTLRGRDSGAAIGIFLPKHFGNPNPEETTALYDLFFWQVKGGGMFKNRCSICHVRARELARQSLIRDGDAVRGRYTGNDMAEFLLDHGRMSSKEAYFFQQLLFRLVPTLDR